MLALFIDTHRACLSMKFLLIHQNFPGQFKFLAPALVQAGHEVVALGVNPLKEPMLGVTYLQHIPQPVTGAMSVSTPGAIKDLYGKMLRGDSCAQMLLQLKANGFIPDVTFAHPGWGEALYVKDVFPQTRLLIYAEYFYGAPGGDVGFDPEFSRPSLHGLQRMRIKNTHLLHAMSVADEGLSPTQFQRDQHPDWFRQRIKVIHDGIDTTRFRPDSAARVNLRGAGIVLQPGDEVITFVARELEPYRGYHIFMRALPLLQRLRPSARIVIVGGDSVSYGAAAPAGTTWKQQFLAEVAGQLDMSRIHFVGKLPHSTLTQLMQVSAAHVYLTYPFVLSWSLMEAMSIGCLIIGSATAPVQEMIRHGENGLLTDFFDPLALAHTVADALANADQLQHLRVAARQHIVERFDLQTCCLPQMLRFVTGQ